MKLKEKHCPRAQFDNCGECKVNQNLENETTCLKSKRNRSLLFCSILKFPKIYSDESKPHAIVYSMFSYINEGCYQNNA